MNSGVYDVKALYVPLFSTAFAPYLKSRFFRTFNYKPTDKLDKILWARRMEKASAVLLDDLYSDIPDTVFYGVHGMFKRTANELLESVRKRFSEELQRDKIVTAAGVFVFVQNDDTQYPSMIELGSGHCILIEPGRLIGYIDGKIISPGFNMRGNRDRTPYEKNFIDGIVERVLVRNSLDEAREFARREIDRLFSGEITREELVCGTRRMSKDWYSFSEPALGRESIKFAQTYQKVKGEPAIRGYVVRNGNEVSIDKKEFLEGSAPTALGYYKFRFFGNDGASGSIGQVAYPALGEDVSDWLGQYSDVQREPRKPRTTRVDPNQLKLAIV